MPQWGFGMPPPGFDELIAKKYAMEQARTDASVNQMNADANRTNVQASLLPTESAASTAETQARTQGINITNQFLPDTLKANIFDTRARGLSSIGSYDQSEQQARQIRGLTTTFSPSQLGLTYPGGL